jgi:hypothetical protein
LSRCLLTPMLRRWTLTATSLLKTTLLTSKLH